MACPGSPSPSHQPRPSWNGSALVPRVPPMCQSSSPLKALRGSQSKLYHRKNCRPPRCTLPGGPLSPLPSSGSRPPRPQRLVRRSAPCPRSASPSLEKFRVHRFLQQNRRLKQLGFVLSAPLAPAGRRCPAGFPLGGTSARGSRPPRVPPELPALPPFPCPWGPPFWHLVPHPLSHPLPHPWPHPWRVPFGKQ